MSTNKSCYISEIGFWIDKKKKYFRRCLFAPSKISRYIIRKKANNKGIFESVYSYETTNQEESLLYGDYYIDFDSDNYSLVKEDVIKAISYLKIVFGIKDIDNSIQIFFSGKKGVHLIVFAEILGVQPMKNLNMIYKVMSTSIKDVTKNKTVDIQIYDNKRLFRIPNSIHEDTGLYKIILSYDEFINLDEDQVKDLAKKPRPIKKCNKRLNYNSEKMFNVFTERVEKEIENLKNIKYNCKLKYTPPCIHKILLDGAPSGNRNNTVAILSSFYKSTGMDLDETINLISSWNNEKNTPPLSFHEVKRTCMSLFSTDKCFGCSSIKALDLCKEEECKLKKGENNNNDRK